MARAAACYSITALRQMLSIKFLFFISCISFALSVIWIQTVSILKVQHIQENLINEALENAGKDARYFEVYRVPSRLTKDVKFILLWTPEQFSPFYFLGQGQRAFINNNCSSINCYVTSDRNLLGGDVTKFDAIAFNGRNLDQGELPESRSPKQKYIFFNLESADNYPVCDEIFDDFFNWTSTYRLDSDIPFPYLLIRNIDGDIVGPKQNMYWENDGSDIDEELPYRLQNKSKAAAWFVSHCSCRSGRKQFAKKLEIALQPYGLSVDTYGLCGRLQCPIDNKSMCFSMLERDYYFYMSLENSFAEDYVTEKLLTALQHNVVPIVYGGANYSRFLPPGSYLNGRSGTPEELAARIASIIVSPKQYQRFFRWKQHYTYHDPQKTESVCAVCAALNNDTMREATTVYKEFRRWWNPNYTNRC